jgi:hypothetical protein
VLDRHDRTQRLISIFKDESAADVKPDVAS